MTFQHAPEHFSVTARLRQRECARTLPEVDTASHAFQTAETMMVQTPNGAAMIVPVRRRVEEQHADVAPRSEMSVYVFEPSAPGSLKQNGMPLPQIGSGRALVAAAPDR